MIYSKIRLAVVAILSTLVLTDAYAGDKIQSRWADEIDTAQPWNVYPRPMLERDNWKNLNGYWQYAIVPQKAGLPTEWQGDILVPYAVESSLSGVERRVRDNEALWYNRTFTVPSSWKGQDIMLNFGAVDWSCEVWVNDIKVGSHKGGYTPFSLNITPALNNKGENTLTVRVTDPTDHGYQPRGKQVNRPGGIWYTPVTGIWQTVWMEPVNKNHIASIKTTPDIDRNVVKVEVNPVGGENNIAQIAIIDNGQTIASGKTVAGEPVEIHMPENAHLWSPDSPYLYDMEIVLLENGKVVDKVNSYTALRKFSTARDDKGIVRLQLNNKNLFQYGPLDQGWWPDGLYTAPTYEAMIYDIDKTKDWGFNMIRKHVKVEPELWYAYCDRKGILVWQDMPNGDNSPEWQAHQFFNGAEKQRSAESEANYRREWKEIIDANYNHPCIATWIPFNEAWGQFKGPEIAEWTKSYDPSRLVNQSSGGNHYHVGDMIDTHHYPAPNVSVIDGARANVLGEFGGIGMVAEGHLWAPDRNWGYVQFNTPKQVTDEYEKYIRKLIDLAKSTYSAAVYTQTTDVEVEVNGLMTYDREVIKIDEDRVRAINQELCNSLNVD
ncbi:MAG: beta-galactosidase [Muribaculaceae bacterium]|nr:beta-galactosidase [Muribaculaceae bacterium]